MKFKSDIEVQAGLKDSSGALGASGQILSSTNGNVSWVTPTVNTVARDVQNLVKAGVAINKGQAVYVTGADGTNIIVGLASNTSEATSSKTLGLLNATVAINGMADVVQIGRLAGLNTIGATAGDPVWLGTNGNLIYGLTNKPYAPAHLVFLGIVTRVNSNNGEIFVNVQNGFELNEIHDVDLKTTVPINGDILGYNGTLWVNKTIAGWLGYTPANASGTTNYVAKFTGANSLGDSQIFDTGTNVGIGTNLPQATLQVGNGTGVKSIYVTGGGTNLGLGGLSVSFLGFATGTISTVFTSAAVPLGVGTRSTQPLVLGTNNAERMRIDSSGNVGIGTTSPSGKLTIKETYTSLEFNTEQYKSQILSFDRDLGSYRNIEFRGYDFIFSPSDVEKVRITNTGNVGIGTSSPSEKFQIGNSFKVSNDGVTTWGVTNGNGILSWDSNLAIIGGLANTSVQFRANNAEVMRLATSGNVGIGTTSPSKLLDVNGDALINGLTIGRGSGNSIQNIAVGGVALYSNTTGTGNTAIGYYALSLNTSGGGNVAVGNASLSAITSGSENTAIGIGSLGNLDAGNYNTCIGSRVAELNTDSSGMTLIGCDLKYKPNNVSLLDNNELAIAQQVSGANGLVHFYAPDTVSVAATSTGNVLIVDPLAYSAVFLDYMIDDLSDNLRAGTIKAIFRNNLLAIEWDESATASIGSTLDYIFNVQDNGGGLLAITLTNNNPDNPVFCRLTSRILLRVN